MREVRDSGERQCLNSRIKVKAGRHDTQPMEKGERWHRIRQHEHRQRLEKWVRRPSVSHRKAEKEGELKDTSIDLTQQLSTVRDKGAESQLKQQR